MTMPLSANTQAILLLTAPLLAGKGSASPDLLSPSEYKRLALHLREIKKQPSDLVSHGAAEVLRECKSVVDEGRLERLLGRGFLLSQVVDRWQTKAIWVVSRADPEYPRHIKFRLKEESPAILYGCGDQTLLNSGGLAVVGSRNVDDELVEYTMALGRLAARAGRAIVSGGARGIDQAAMRGALEAGGRVSGVLADSLEKTAMSREQRNYLIDGQLVLISPYDPGAGFNVGHAMQRNKLIYALADTSLVVNSDEEKGGTWAGATEQLYKLRYVPVYIRSTGEPSPGLEALHRQGASYWPNPQSVEEFDLLFETSSEARSSEDQASNDALDSSELDRKPTDVPEPSETLVAHSNEVDQEEEVRPLASNETPPTPTVPEETVQAETPSTQTSIGDTLFVAVRAMLKELLKEPMKEAEVAAALDVTTAQAKAWLQRLADEGLVIRQRNPAGYVNKREDLFN